MIITADILKGREYISVATADKDAKPNAAPKFLLKFEKPYLFLIDYSFATTTENLRVNPRAALSFMDLENLEGYRLYGSVANAAARARICAKSGLYRTVRTL